MLCMLACPALEHFARAIKEDKRSYCNLFYAEGISAYIEIIYSKHYERRLRVV